MAVLTTGLIPFSDFSSRQWHLFSADVAFIVITSITVFLRVYTRLFMVKKLGVDDIIIMIAYLLGLAFTTLSLMCVRLGIGAHITSVKNFPGFLQAAHAAILLYPTVITFTKISIVASFLRILPNPTIRIIMWASGVVTLCLWISFLIVDAALGKDWALKLEQLQKFVYFSYVFAGISACTDFILCFAPITIFWELQISLKEKVILCGLFATGLIASISAIIRATQLQSAISQDVTYNSAPGYIWSTTECGLAMVCACVPTLRPLAVRLWPNGFLSRAGRSDHKTNPLSYATMSRGRSRALGESRHFSQDIKGPSVRLGSVPRSDETPLRSDTVLVTNTVDVEIQSRQDLSVLDLDDLEHGPNRTRRWTQTISSRS